MNPALNGASFDCSPLVLIAPGNSPFRWTYASFSIESPLSLLHACHRCSEFSCDPSRHQSDPAGPAAGNRLCRLQSSGVQNGSH